MSYQDLEACRRMRACLAGILDLDPDGVATRLAEMDREIARLEALLGCGPQAAAPEAPRLEVIPIGVKAA
jgi:hypothetical protein